METEYQQAMAILTKHLMLNIPTPPPKWVYDILEKYKK
jgi:hypothetical protein